MSDSIADDLLRNGYDRWLRLEEEKAAISGDLKELMAELKGHGFTPKALRESFRRVRNIDDADQREHDETVDLYVASLTRGTRAMRAREIIEEFAADVLAETEPATHAADDGEGGGEDAPASLADTIRQDDPADAVVGGTQPVSDRFHSEPGNGLAGEKPVVATRQGGEESGMLDSLPAANHNFTRIPVLGEVH